MSLVKRIIEKQHAQFADKPEPKEYEFSLEDSIQEQEVIDFIKRLAAKKIRVVILE